MLSATLSNPCKPHSAMKFFLLPLFQSPPVNKNCICEEFFSRRAYLKYRWFILLGTDCVSFIHITGKHIPKHSPQHKFWQGQNDKVINFWQFIVSEKLNLHVHIYIMLAYIILLNILWSCYSHKKIKASFWEAFSVHGIFSYCHWLLLCWLSFPQLQNKTSSHIAQRTWGHRK